MTARDEPLSVAMRVNNPDRSPFLIYRRNPNSNQLCSDCQR
jgi:hypothetical protein